MEEDLAEVLVNEMSRKIKNIDKLKCLEILIPIPVSGQDKTSIKLPYENAMLYNEGQFYFFSLRRVIRNKDVSNKHMTELQKTWSLLISQLRVYSSDALIRDMEQDDNISHIISACNCPYSMLGKMETQRRKRQGRYLKTRPVLIIPEYSQHYSVINWEDRNTIYEKEVLFPSFFPLIKFDKLVPAEEFYSP